MLKRGKSYQSDFFIDGKRYVKSWPARTKGEAVALEEKWKTEIRSGVYDGTDFRKVTFDMLADLLLRDYRINEKRIDRADRSLSHLRPVFEGFRVPDIGTAEIHRYVDDRLSDGAANATINRELSALKRMFNLGLQQSPPLVNRKPYIRMLKENNVRTGFFEHAEFLALRDELPAYLKGVITFGYKTGWRIREITGLQWSNVDLANGIVRLNAGTTKNKQGRVLYLDDELRSIIEGQRTQRKPLPWVFPNEPGTGQIKEFRGAWDKACNKAGIGHKMFHDFRRSAARNLVRSGTPEAVAMKITGHKTRSVFERYNIVTGDDLERAVKRQAEYLETQKTGLEHEVRSLPERSKKFA